MKDVSGVVYWGRSDTVPITPTALQHHATVDDSLIRYDFSDQAGHTGYWAIAVPETLDPINTVRFLDSPLDMLPITESTTVSFSLSDVTQHRFEIASVGNLQGIQVVDAAQFTLGQTLTISDGTRSMTATIETFQRANHMAVRTVSITAGAAGDKMHREAVVTATRVVPYLVSRAPVPLIGFDSLIIVATGNLSLET